MDDMKITMTFLVRNEEDILEQNILFHHAQGINSFIVMDNLSTDRTPEIIRALSSKLNVEYIYQPQDDYSQSEWVTEMAKHACTVHKADWVINNDADEFWCSRTGTIRDFIASMPEDVGVLRLRRHNAILGTKGRDLLLSAAHPEFTEFFEENSTNVIGLPLPGKCIHRASPIVSVAQGNHDVSGVNGQIIDVESSAYILHYPYRTLTHYKNKIRLGGSAYNRNTSLPSNMGTTWRHHFNLLGTDAIEEFWKRLCVPSSDVLIGAAEGKFFKDRSIVEFLKESRVQYYQKVLGESLTRLMQSTKVEVDSFIDAHVKLLRQFPEEERTRRPFYQNLEFCLNGPKFHLAQIEELEPTGSGINFCKKFPKLRDIFSLFPRNQSFLSFLSTLLHISNPDGVAQLCADCNRKPVILHVSCAPRLHLAQESIASFSDLKDDYHHLIILGKPGERTEDNVELDLSYDGLILSVPVPDDYENLHRKIFYALMIIHLVANPTCVVKIDDNLVLHDVEEFTTLIERVVSKKIDYAGRLVGSRFHDTQWHGWHINKCRDASIEERGYQYPLPAQYAAGGYGYILGKQGIAACAYMYLAMKEFFSMKSVGLEDAYVGHAMYAKGIELEDVASEKNLLSLPGLSSRDTIAT